MKLKKGKKEYLILAFICIDSKKDLKLLDIRDLKGFTLTDGKD